MKEAFIYKEEIRSSSWSVDSKFSLCFLARFTWASSNFPNCIFCSDALGPHDFYCFSNVNVQPFAFCLKQGRIFYFFRSIIWLRSFRLLLPLSFKYNSCTPMAKWCHYQSIWYSKILKSDKLLAYWFTSVVAPASWFGQRLLIIFR